MQVYSVSKSNITYKSHYYRVYPFSHELSVSLIKNEKQGKLPFIIFKDYDKEKLVDNALIIEKEFGAPQDIEGGFKDNDIYLWQTRNIVQ